MFKSPEKLYFIEPRADYPVAPIHLHRSNQLDVLYIRAHFRETYKNSVK